MNFSVKYTDMSGNLVTEFCKTESFAKKRAKQRGGTWKKLPPLKKQSDPTSTYRKSQSFIDAAVKAAMAKPVAEILNPK